MTATVIQGVQKRVLVLTISHPPVNASSQAVRQGLMDGIDRLDTDTAVDAAVIIGAENTFIAGSDISEFGAEIPSPLLPEVIQRIETSSKPVIAAIDGFALGGGLELALGCDARIATSTAQLGLPEVTLGMLPGAGGTQRLPRLVGRETAAELIVTGRRISGAQAFSLGLVEALADTDLRTQAIARATSQAKRRVIEMDVPDKDRELAEHFSRILGASPRPPAVEAVRLIDMSATTDAQTALAAEREIFTQLRTGPDALALRHLFFAERASGRRMNVPQLESRVDTAAVVGAGAMGSSICAILAMAGMSVILLDADAAQARTGAEQAGSIITGAVKRAKLSEAAGAEAVARITVASAVDDLASARFVVEAVFEDMTVKGDVLNEIHRVAPDAVIATNTSYLSIAALANCLDDASQLIGLHFFNPAHALKLVEVIPTPHTSQIAISTALSIVKQLRKIPVIAGDAEGFIANRIFSAYRRHAEYLLEDGALPAEVDQAIEAFGFAMGPFAVADLSGLQIAQSLRDRQRAEGKLPARYVEIPDILCGQSRFGRRSGQGYYDYSDGSKKADDRVAELIRAESARKGIERRQFNHTDIVERLVGAMVLESIRVLREGIALYPDDIDVAMVNGFGFPRFMGGPLWWASTQPEAKLRALLHHVAGIAREEVPEDLVLTRGGHG